MHTLPNFTHLIWRPFTVLDLCLNLVGSVCIPKVWERSQAEQWRKEGAEKETEWDAKWGLWDKLLFRQLHHVHQSRPVPSPQSWKHRTQQDKLWLTVVLHCVSPSISDSLTTKNSTGRQTSNMTGHDSKTYSVKCILHWHFYEYCWKVLDVWPVICLKVFVNSIITVYRYIIDYKVYHEEDRSFLSLSLERSSFIFLYFNLFLQHIFFWHPGRNKMF